MLVVGSDIRAILQNVANLTRVFPAFYQNLTRCLSASGHVVCGQPGQIFGQIMTSLELLLALADEETLELARRMIGKPRLALLLAKAAIETEGGAALDAGRWWESRWARTCLVSSNCPQSNWCFRGPLEYNE